MNPHTKKQVSFWIGVFLILITACGGQGSPTPEPRVGANSIVIATFTATPTNSSLPSETPTPILSPSSDAKATGQLPGLSPSNVTVRLEEQQFTCTSVSKRTVYQRTCSRGVPGIQVFYVVLSGREPFVVDLIEATVLQYENPDPKSAISVLSLIAAIPYDGATPEEAVSWVENTVPVVSSDPGEAHEEVFGGVKYVLSGPPTKLKLEIGELP